MASPAGLEGTPSRIGRKTTEIDLYFTERYLCGAWHVMVCFMLAAEATESLSEDERYQYEVTVPRLQPLRASPFNGKTSTFAPQMLLSYKRLTMQCMCASDKVAADAPVLRARGHIRR